MDTTATKSTSEQQPDRIALESAVVVRSLSAVCAELQAKAAGHRAIFEAAHKRQLVDLSGDAALRVEVYEEAATSLHQIISGIVAGRQGMGLAATPTEEGRSAVPYASLQRHCDAVSSLCSRLCVRAVADKVAAHDRYVALVGVVRELEHSSTKPLPQVVSDDVSKLYIVITDKLPDLGEVGKALKKMQQEWRTSTVTSATTPDPEQVRRSDWFKKMAVHVEELRALRIQVGAGDSSTATLDNYERRCDIVIANMTTQQYPGGIVQALAEATTKELRRLRQDCGVAAAMARLGRGNAVAS